MKEENREVAIAAEHVKKEYRLGVIGRTTLKRDLQTRIALARGKEDPNSKIGQPNVRDGILHALDDVSFKIYKGERIGIIGQNGAGKSTLLKLICRITAPSDGFIGYNGKVTSMLEVGTGFHPELTGRENVYMNGAILGMSRQEVSKVFDQIVEFSEVGKFIDTPVKRYSSGMYVRLAFSVAAHLNSDIVIMDEVLAVGDVGFQEKCIQRMREISENENRTILYVSHNMATVHALCDRCFVLREGQLVFDGNPSEAEQFYRRTIKGTAKDYSTGQDRLKDEYYEIMILESSYPYESRIDKEGKLVLRVKWMFNEDVDNLHLRFEIKMTNHRSVATKVFMDIGGGKKGEIREQEFEVDLEPLQNGSYETRYVFFQLDSNGDSATCDEVYGIPFSVNDAKKDKPLHWRRNWWGAIRLK